MAQSTEPDSTRFRCRTKGLNILQRRRPAGDSGHAALRRGTKDSSVSEIEITGAIAFRNRIAQLKAVLK
jgi:hypothetical protein